MSLQSDIVIADGWFIGEDKVLIYDVVDQNASTTPVDITGWTIHWELSATYSGASLFVITAALTSPTAGRCGVTIPSASTIGLTGDKDYWYSLRRTDTGAKEEVAFGTCWLRDVWVNYP